ncbi:SSI family serine proteinase inhibitor [Modestobacter sp. SYSU DS0511]
MRRALLMLPLLLLAACATGSDGGATRSPAPTSAAPTDDAAAGGGISRADNDLVIEVDPGEGAEPTRYTLTCVGFVEGDLPDAETACAHLEGLADPFAPVPADAVCTQQYGGPQTARITGLWGGDPVDLELSRTDGCRIAQWDRLAPLLPVAVG